MIEGRGRPLSRVGVRGAWDAVDVKKPPSWAKQYPHTACGEFNGRCAGVLLFWRRDWDIAFSEDRERCSGSLVHEKGKGPHMVLHYSHTVSQDRFRRRDCTQEDRPLGNARTSNGASVIRPQALRRPLGRARSALALRVHRNTAAFRGMAH